MNKPAVSPSSRIAARLLPTRRAPAASPPCCQARPNDNIKWQKLTIQQAYAACLTTDALVAAVTAVARGTSSEQQAAGELEAFTVPEVGGWVDPAELLES